MHTVAVLNEWALNHDVELFLPSGSSPEIGDLATSQVKVRRPSGQHRIPSRLNYLVSLTARMCAATWYVLRRRGHWDVVIASSHFAFDALPMLLARNCGVRAVYWHHHITAAQGRPAWVVSLVRISEILLVPLVTLRRVRVLTGNSDTERWLRSRGVSPHAIALTPNGPSLQAGLQSDEETLRKEPSLLRFEGRKFVLFCARLSNLKGAGDLPMISRHVVAANEATPIVICGPESESAEAKAVRRALEPLEKDGSVTFLGLVSESCKRWLFQHAHVLIAPSYEEGWGVTVADGLASGCWVVAYDLPALRESCPDGPVFVPLGDVESFARATTACLEKPLPPPRARVTLGLWNRIAEGDLGFILDGRVSRQIS